MKDNAKILPLDDLAARLAALRPGRVVVHCHGVFDLVHIGHIRHFQQARQMGDLLVVTLTPDRFVNKGPDRPAFPEHLRVEALAASIVCAARSKSCRVSPLRSTFPSTLGGGARRRYVCKFCSSRLPNNSAICR